MNSNPTTSRASTITARPTADEKRRFAELAVARGISESALALIAIRALLDSNGAQIRTTTPEPRRQPATDRITIRLRPGDRCAINERAAERDIRPSRYLAALVRTHIAASPTLTTDELSVLKKGVSVLAALRRALSHTARSIAAGGPLPPNLQTELAQTRAVAAAIEQRTHDLVRSALITWNSRHE